MCTSLIFLLYYSLQLFDILRIFIIYEANVYVFVITQASWKLYIYNFLTILEEQILQFVKIKNRYLQFSVTYKHG